MTPELTPLDPGPGHYEDKFSILKSKNPRTVFGQSRKNGRVGKTDIPGVGTYDTSFYDIKRTKKGYSLGKSHRFKNPQVRGIRHRKCVKWI